ncbi:Methyltransf-11 domain-containing protein [Aphelenchoides fujianensis]|nr:Methyltransf-11 domain-containing protein [Aphelenchoides fujianensis]
MLHALFTANLAGIVFARSIHFQFYTWYFHSLFYLLYSSISFELLPPKFEHLGRRFVGWILVALVLGGIEFVFNVYPPRPSTSALLLAEHLGIVGWLLFLRSEGRKSAREGRTLREECGYRIADRVFDLTKFNDVCVDLGCGAGFIAPHLVKENVGVLIQCDMSERMVAKSRGAPNDEFPTCRLVADEETVPFRDQSVDLVLSSLAAHWINDLPGWFRRCFRILRPDGALIGSLLAGETIHEVRVSLQLAEMERLGGIGAHVSPFVQPQDISGLMGRAGFEMITLDVEDIEIGYPNLFALLYDLQAMGESNASAPPFNPSPRDMYGTPDGHLPCTFQVLSFIGWRPGPETRKPAKRGSQSVSLKDLGKFVESPEMFEPQAPKKE